MKNTVNGRPRKASGADARQHRMNTSPTLHQKLHKSAAALARDTEDTIDKIRNLRRGMGHSALLGAQEEPVVLQSAISASHQLRTAEEALELEKDGRYGTCTDCGKRIPEARMKALRYLVSRCIRCAKNLEQGGVKTDREKENWEEVASSERRAEDFNSSGDTDAIVDTLARSSE